LSDLVIVESPAKAHTIARYLGKGFKVVSSMGHVRDLPEDELGVDIEKGFQPHFVIKDPKVVRRLREEARKAKTIYLATDNDREGEAIAFDLYEVLNHHRNPGNGQRYRRIVFNEITKRVILQAIKEPREIDLARVEAQRARRILDRLVGYLVSPLLSKSLSGSIFEGLSAGRVQSVALRLICDREREIQEFTPKEYWTIEAELLSGEGKGEGFRAKLEKYRGRKPELPDKAAVERALAELKGLESEFQVVEVRERERLRKPPPPFITSTLQQAASSQLGFSPQRTMQLAQQLYEGVELGEEGREGLITYHRTDSTRVSTEAQRELRAFIERHYGKEYLAPQVRTYKPKGKGAQDAHEAIRPTSVERTPDKVAGFLTRDQYKLYKLIWERFVATQMAEAVYLQREAEIAAGDYLFKVSGSTPKFEGFLKVLKLAPLKDEGLKVPELRQGERLKLVKLIPEQHFTEPPSRFTEAGLVKLLEEKGIGRPSTYAPIIATIEERGYVVREKKGVLRPTLLGFVTTDFLREFFPLTVQEEFTARMEESLDKIGAGELTRVEVLQKFYKPLEEQLNRVRQELQDGRHSFHILTNLSCPICGAPMELRFWKGKRYLGCSRYPDCQSTREFPEGVSYRYEWEDHRVSFDLEELRAHEAAPKAKRVHPELLCPECGAPMELREGRFGRFYGCTRYPECKGTRPYSVEVPCPLCGAELVERYSPKSKKLFYGCSRYPECRFIAPDQPVKLCPACSEGVLIKMKVKGKQGEWLVCTNKECGHREPLD